MKNVGLGDGCPLDGRCGKKALLDRIYSAELDHSHEEGVPADEQVGRSCPTPYIL